MKRLGTAFALARGGLRLPPSAIGQDARAAARALAVGQSVAGELSPNDTQRRSGKYEDVYMLAGPARRSAST